MFCATPCHSSWGRERGWSCFVLTPSLPLVSQVVSCTFIFACLWALPRPERLSPHLIYISCITIPREEYYTIMTSDGESGSPRQTPLLRLKEGVEKPLLITQRVIIYKTFWSTLKRIHQSQRIPPIWEGNSNSKNRRLSQNLLQSLYFGSLTFL